MNSAVEHRFIAFFCFVFFFVLVCLMNSARNTGKNADATLETLSKPTLNSSIELKYFVFFNLIMFRKKKNTIYIRVNCVFSSHPLQHIST